jgi:hypothetical protein
MSVRLVKRFSDDSANVIFAEDGGLESVGHCAGEHTNCAIVQGQKGLPIKGKGASGHLLLGLGPGMPSPETISRSSWRAVMWPMPTSPRCSKSSKRQPLGEQLAVDNPLAKARDHPEADPPRELVECRADAAQIVRIDMLEAVAKDHPVDALAGRLRPLGAAVPDQLGVEAGLGHLEIFRVDLADEIEVDEAVVHRRDERVGQEDRLAGDGSSRPGVSITTTSASARKPGDRILERNVPSSRTA